MARRLQRRRSTFGNGAVGQGAADWSPSRNWLGPSASTGKASLRSSLTGSPLRQVDMAIHEDREWSGPGCPSIDCHRSGLPMGRIEFHEPVALQFDEHILDGLHGGITKPRDLLARILTIYLEEDVEQSAVAFTILTNVDVDSVARTEDLAFEQVFGHVSAHG